MPLILRKSRVRRRACTDLCGGRPVKAVPTATEWMAAAKCAQWQPETLTRFSGLITQAPT